MQARDTQGRFTKTYETMLPHYQYTKPKFYTNRTFIYTLGFLILEALAWQLGRYGHL